MITYKRRHPFVRFCRQTFYKVYNFFKKLYWKFWKPKTFGVKLMIFNSNGEILLAQIGYMHKLWVIPGGKLESGENPDEAAKRELYEEIGVKIDEVKLAFTMYHEKQGKKDTIYYFITNSDCGEFVIDDEEIIDVGWFALDNLPELRTQRIDDALIKYNEVKSTI